ncbi:uncharacterized protein LOC114256045 isoform X3 [Camellia sinensis]|uniref:uncharacterized protein LOC114256045 isoform X3 n=1 Tax=Camellia sinensis TaxID=4442 RepID=UPI001035D552|nr:uncharacterized protein LOC114256045 isoform X3 [Camellia sinensis]XP_028051432.1 uncharacterized protein LOC114256045 isoform X3 [Camellia sinensis]XP_028051433.1 uncharacterized protein LOC114256045 isoform X3 [Camellia sinensis]
MIIKYLMPVKLSIGILPEFSLLEKYNLLERAVSITPSTAHQLIQGNKRNDTICIALADDTCDQPKIRMNNVVITPSFKIGDGWNIIRETSKDYILNF